MSRHAGTSESIPLQKVVSHSSTIAGIGMRKGSSAVRTVDMANTPTLNEKTSGKGGLFHRHTRGRRQVKRVDSRGVSTGRKGYDGEEDTVTWMGQFYTRFMNISIITRYFIYVLPLGLALAVPIVIGATAAKNTTIGGVRIVWFFTWIEIVWLGLWVTRIVAHFLPKFFMFFAGVVSSGTRKYGLMLKSLQMPISIALWAAVSLATFLPLMTNNPDVKREVKKQEEEDDPVTANKVQHWESIVNDILWAGLVASLIFLAERVLIQLISINYHRKQFNAKILESKHNVYLLSLLYDASRTLFPMFGKEFAEEDYLITDSLDLALPGMRGPDGHARSGSGTPIRILQDVGRVGDKVTSVFGNIASEITGKQLLNPHAAHSIVVEALERNRSAEALAKRLWMSFVVEGKEALYPEDIQEVLGPHKSVEAEEAFSAIDRDGNGDISLDEMILMVTEIGRERKSVANSMHDVDQAIKALDALLSTVVFIICIFVLVAFLNHSFVTTLATAGTALLSLSFVFAVTCQEVLGSCIFLFVKHPYDIGDRVDITDVSLTVEHISLLFTVFKRVCDGKMVQIPNIVLNTLWVNNVTRSKAMREQISIFVHFDTSFDDIKLLRQEMHNFVTDKDNSRDFQPDIEVECVGIAEMNKLELRVEIRHKGNWHNETVRAARRSKFMCALVLALRKVPIYAPGGGDASLGSIGAPSYSVAISMEEAQKGKDDYAATKEAKRLVPTPKKEPPVDYEVFPAHETKAVDILTSRAPHADFPRDEAYNSREQNEQSDSSNTLSESTYGYTAGEAFERARSPAEQQQLDETREVLRRQSTRGRRKPHESPDYAPSSSQLWPSSASAATRPSNDGREPEYASPLARNPTGADSPYSLGPSMSQPGAPPSVPPPGGPYQGPSAGASSRQGPIYRPSGAPPPS